MSVSMVVEHLSMVVLAIVIAVVIGIPLGLICYLHPTARKIILRVVDFIQTTPALALLGIIMVIMAPESRRLFWAWPYTLCCPLSAI